MKLFINFTINLRLLILVVLGLLYTNPDMMVQVIRGYKGMFNPFITLLALAIALFQEKLRRQ